MPSQLLQIASNLIFHTTIESGVRRPETFFTKGIHPSFHNYLDATAGIKTDKRTKSVECCQPYDKR
jgi:hypothetical protein